MKRYPFKFLDAYTKEDRAIFFGREQEIDDLYRMVFQTNLLLVYGGSGTGKTSLIRCGLSNRFKESQWLDLYIRRGADMNEALLETIAKNTPQLSEAAIEEEGLDWFETVIEKEVSNVELDSASTLVFDHPVAQALQELYLATFTPIYLIFDQFEELYTLGNRAEQKRFTETIVELVQLALPIKIIIVMREEYLAKLYELEKAIPQLRNKKVRIEAMDLPRVENIILQATAQNPNSNVSLTDGQESAIAKAIIEKIREGDVNIKLPYLQVFMDRLYEIATGEAINREQQATFSLELVQQAGNIGDVLGEFIERQSQLIYKKLAQKYEDLPNDIVWQLLSPFATIDGTKVPIRQTNLSIVEGVLPAGNRINQEAFIKEVIAELETSRILRYRKEEQTYEVAHDTLAKQIAEKRSEEEKAYLKAKRIVTEGMATYWDTHTLLSKEQLAYIQPYVQRLESELTDIQNAYIRDSVTRRRAQVRWLRIGIAAAFIIAALVIVIVLREQQKTQAALDNVLEAQGAREKTELQVLLQDATQISKGSNCPPAEMRQTIDSLYQKHNSEQELVRLYQETIERLKHCK